MKFWATEYVKTANQDLGGAPNFPLHTAVGAGLGALPGAGLGYLAGGGKGALIGAGIGAGMGAISGSLRAHDKLDALKGQMRFNQLPPEQQQRISNLYDLANADVPLAPQAEADLDPHYWHLARMQKARRDGMG